MAAELAGPQDGGRPGAHATIEIHKLVETEPGTAAFGAGQTLARTLEYGAPEGLEAPVYPREWPRGCRPKA